MSSSARPPLTVDLDSRALGRNTYLLRMLTVLSLVAVCAGVVTSQGWWAAPRDNSRPPFERPSIASVVPTDAEVTRLVGTQMLRVQDGPPTRRLFTSIRPLAFDLRASGVRGAWQATWTSTDSGTRLVLEVVQRAIRGVATFTEECTYSSSLNWPAPFVKSGTRDVGGRTEVCGRAQVHDTDLLLGVESSSPPIAAGLATAMKTLSLETAQKIPPQLLPTTTTAATPATRAAILRAFMLAILIAPLAWSIPTLLFDRATWQRLRRRLKGRRKVHLRNGVDVDPASRRLASIGALMGATQWAGAVWVDRAAEQFYWGMNETVALVIGTVVTIGAVQRRLLRRRGRSARLFHGRRIGAAFVGASLTVGAIILAAFIAKIAVILSAVVIAPDTPDYVFERLSSLTWVLVLILVLLSSYPMMVARRLAMRALRRESLADARPPVLLLRSFADDKRRVRARGRHRGSLIDQLSLRRWERFEEIVAHALGAWGPVLAVGQVGEKLPPALGAVRRQFTNDEWETAVSELMNQAQLICVSMGRSESLAWEIRRILANGHIRKTIFVFPPTSAIEQRRRMGVLAHLIDVPWNLMEVDKEAGTVLAISQPDPQSPPVVVYARAQEDVGYDIALDVCSELVKGARRPALRGGDPEEVAEVSAPASEVFPRGMAPKYRSIGRRLWVLGGWGASALLTMGMTFLIGENPDTFKTIAFNQDFSPSSFAQDATGNDFYAVMNRTLIVAIDFSKESVLPVVRVPSLDTMVVRNHRLYYSSASRGEVAAVDLSTGKTLWMHSKLRGVRALGFHGDQLVFVSPSESRVTLVDARTGVTRASTKLAGVPWALVNYGDVLYVSLIDRSLVETLDGRTLAVTGQYRTDADPIQLATNAQGVWVQSAISHNLTLLTGSGHGPQFLLSDQFASLAGDSSTLAIGGIDQITTVDDRARIRHLHLNVVTASALTVTSQGGVIAGDSGEITLYAPASG
jgi:hypothetical protein